MSKLEKLQELHYLSSRGSHFRCSICNTVSNESVETNIGDYKPSMSFTADPNRKPNSMVCIECKEVIDDTLVEYDWDQE